MNINTNVPSAGRVYDYVLGGHNNFEIDRVTAEHILKLVPSYPRWARLNRWFLQLVAERWTASGHSSILDLGSGLPTQGYFHSVMPGARVLYTDKDPETVAYARQVLSDTSAVAFLETDFHQPAELRTTAVTFLETDFCQPAELLATAERFFGGVRRIAVGFIGVSYVIDDASMERIARTLHAWAAPGSVMALSFGSLETSSAQAQSMLESFKRNATELFIRDETDIRRLMAPWRIQECRPLASWLGLDTLIEEADREGMEAEMFGVLLEHAG